MLRHARLMRVPLAWLYGEEPADGKGMESPESRYLVTKWRKDSGDPATGLNGPALRAELERRLPQWTREGSWTMTKAKAFCFLCDRTAIDVSDLDWFPAFALWTRHTPKLHPLQEILARRDREVTAASLPAGLARPQGLRWCGYHDYDHSAPDWDVILPLGFTGLAARLAAHDDGSEYYVARKLAMEGIFRFLDRLVAKGRTVPGDRARQQTESIARLRQGPPVTALDALQFIYLYWTICEKFEMIQVRTLGNLDKLLTPYYRADLAAGRTTEAEFRAELRHFWWQWGSIDNYYGQPVYFGGTKADGTTEYNEVSKILLEVHDELALPTPKVHLKMGKSTPDWVWRQTLEMMRRQRPLSFVGEEPHGRVIRAMGYDEDCARTFMLWGCYEWAVRDSANDTCAAQVNLLHPVTALLADAAAGRFAAETFDDFKAAYLVSVGATVSAARDFAFENEKSLAEVNPALLFSVATEYSVKTGRDAYQGGTAHGNNSAIWMVGTGTSVDALLAVKELVYENEECRMKNEERRAKKEECGGWCEDGRKARFSLRELGEILAKNWEGHEELRLRMRRSHRKWGNNDPEANRLARELQKHVASLVNGRPNSRGGVFKACGHTARWHVMMGKGTGATPDGRKAGEEFSKNISPTMGADTEGVTALLASVANLDAKDYPGDFPLDVALLPSTVAGEKGLALMRTVVETYFDNGGLVIQFNLHDPRVLRDAQKHPEKYANLQVRITGWNVRWNDLPKVEQDRFIERAERIGQ